MPGSLPEMNGTDLLGVKLADTAPKGPKPTAPSEHAGKMVVPLDWRSVLAEGLDLCRQERWQEALDRLATLADHRDSLPSIYFSSLGLALAHGRKQLDEGHRLCHHAIRMEFFEPENYANLARVFVLGHRRRQAIRVIRKGLTVDRTHQGLRALYLEMGVRRRPPLPFLHRSHPINSFLGRLRHQLMG